MVLQHLEVHSHIHGIPLGTLTACLHQLEQWVWVRGGLGEVCWEFTGSPDFDFDIVCAPFPTDRPCRGNEFWLQRDESDGGGGVGVVGGLGWFSFSPLL